MPLYSQKKEAERESHQGIFFDEVLDLMPENCSVILRIQEFPYCCQIFLHENDFPRFKFEAIKWIKKRAHPEDRLWPFEAKEGKFYSYDKELFITESRKTRKEKDAEKQEHIGMLKLFKEHGIEH